MSISRHQKDSVTCIAWYGAGTDKGSTTEYNVERWVSSHWH